MKITVWSDFEYYHKGCEVGVGVDRVGIVKTRIRSQSHKIRSAYYQQLYMGIVVEVGVEVDGVGFFLKIRSRSRLVFTGKSLNWNQSRQNGTRLRNPDYHNSWRDNASKTLSSKKPALSRHENKHLANQQNKTKSLESGSKMFVFQFCINPRKMV